jgi:chromosome segregation ATPase
MKQKLVLWGSNTEGQKLMMALQLRAQDNKVDLWTFPEENATEDFYSKMLNEWRSGQEVEFPQPYTHTERDLSLSESLLPDHLKAEQPDLITRAQTEWHFTVLSTKLSEMFQSELADIKEKVGKLKDFDNKVWDDLKSFWDKIQQQVTEKNLLREHTETLREGTNQLFTDLKNLRKQAESKAKETSTTLLADFNAALDKVEEKINNNQRIQGIFDELKQLQQKLKDQNLLREHRNKLWERIDKLFKSVKEQRFGKTPEETGSAVERIQRRLDGLVEAITRMDQSIKRDEDELNFQQRRNERANNQLEVEIRKAKVQMVQERLRSKQEKLAEMNKTRGELERKIENEKSRETKRAEQAAQEAQRKAVEEQVKARIQEESKHNLESKAEELQKAANALHATPEPKDAESNPAEEESNNSIIDAVTATVGEALEDVVTTISAAAKVVGHEISERVEDLLHGDDDKDKEDQKGETPEEDKA